MLITFVTGAIDHMENQHPFDPIAEILVKAVIDETLHANRLTCAGRIGGLEGILRRLISAANFNPQQLKIVEYLMNEAAEDSIGKLLSELDVLIGTEQLRISVRAEDGGWIDFDKDDFPERNPLNCYTAPDGWRYRFSNIRQRLEELALAVGVTPVQIDKDSPR